jgi:hypothetical protein
LGIRQSREDFRNNTPPANPIDQTATTPTAATPQSDPLAAARAAIAKGAPRDAVIQRLKQAGIDASGL